MIRPNSPGKSEKHENQIKGSEEGAGPASIANSLAQLLLLRRSGERSLEIFFRSRLVRIVLKQRDFASFGRMGILRDRHGGAKTGLGTVTPPGFSSASARCISIVHGNWNADSPGQICRRHPRGGDMGKDREPQIILKTDQRNVLLELGLDGKFAAKSSGWDENRVFLEGDVLGITVRSQGSACPSTGEVVKSCTMLITEPNNFVAEVHDRMRCRSPQMRRRTRAGRAL
jgi:hypothetical protein